uniref:hypothetical protein n=1 Tax=Dyella sp. ASV21 TaxID=2795114 RepID=UPI0018EDFBFC
LGVEPLEFLGNEFNYLAVLDSARTVRRLQPNLAAIALWNSPGPVSYTHLTLPTTTFGCRSRWAPDH